MLDVIERLKIIDFFINIKLVLSQRESSIRLQKHLELNRDGFHQRFLKILETHGLREHIVLVDSQPDDLDFFEALVNRFFSNSFHSLAEWEIYNLESIEISHENQTKHFSERINRFNLVSYEGVNLNVFTCGDQKKTPIVIVLPTGMPMLIMKSWIEILEKKHFVITWETRGLFNVDKKKDSLELNLEAQLEDLGNIIRYFNINDIHVFGVCQGSNLALYASQKFNSLITSVSIWHGDFGSFSLKNNCKLTFVQENFQYMLNVAKEFESISVLRGIMSNPKSLDTLLNSYTITMLPLIMYPYVTDYIFSNFITLSKDILSRDLENVIDGIKQKVLIVTSQTDKTSHPGASELLHKKLKNSKLFDRQEGSHISFFDAPSKLYIVFDNFINNREDKIVMI